MIESSVRLKVRYQETDRMGIVYYSNYLVWFEIGRTELFGSLGIPYPELEKKGYFLVVTESRCEYKAPVTYEDEIEVSTRLAEIKHSSLTFDYEVRKNEALIASGATRHAFVDREGKAVRIPKFVTEVLTKKEALNG